MFAPSAFVLLVHLLVASNLLLATEAGIIKDIYQKITQTNNRTEETVKQSAPICGSSTFSTPDERSLSPEIIFITSRASSASRDQSATWADERQLSEVAREFRFHEENVTLAQLEANGFNRDAPVTFLMHGFTSGYPLQAWISAIVEAYTIDRQRSSGPTDQQQSAGEQDQAGWSARRRQEERSRDKDSAAHSARAGHQVGHNLFIVNWNYAARGILYPRAVANIPIVASYVTRFINDKLLGEARVDPRRVQLIGHSLGAHLAGFIGKNTKSRLGRIYGLDPAGPCFGAIAGPLYPASKRLAPTDAEEVITLHTNTALLGIDKPIGRYSVYVEGGAVQPGCKAGGVLKSLQTLTWDGGNFDTVACSHSRAPNLLTYRHDQSDSDDDCQLVAHGCKDWDSFVAGHCGLCRAGGGGGHSSNTNRGPLSAVECRLIGLDWQYPAREPAGSSGGAAGAGPGHSANFYTTSQPHYDDDDQAPSRRPSWDEATLSSQNNSSPAYGQGYSTRRPVYGQQQSPTNHHHQQYSNQNDEDHSSTRRPYGLASLAGDQGEDNYSSSNGRRPTYANEHQNAGRASTKRPSGNQSELLANQRERRNSNATSESPTSEQSSGATETLYLRTGDTQPYCVYQYQVILELNEPFAGGKPSMSLLLQDSKSDERRHSTGQDSATRRGQNSLSNDEFGNKFDDKTYTHLLTSAKKLGRIDHATMLFRDGLPDGLRRLKALHVNYMSHIDPNVRRRLSATLCPVKKNPGQGQGDFSTDKRFYFEPCTGGGASFSHHQMAGSSSYASRRPEKDRQR